MSRIEGELPRLLSSTLVTHIQVEKGHWRLETTDTTKTISALMQWIDRHGHTLVELQIQHPSLEETFLEMTGNQNPGGPAPHPQENP